MDIKGKQKIDLWIGGPMIVLLKPLVVLFGLFLNRNHDLKLRRDVLFIKMQGGGSLLIAMAALVGLRKKYPDCKFRLLTTPAVKPFAESIGIFDEMIVVSDTSMVAVGTSGVKALLRSLFSDTVIDLEVYSRMTAIFGLATLARNRIGFYLESSFWREKVFTHLIFFNRSSGTYHFYEDIARRLGATPADHEECKLRLMEVNRIEGQISAKNTNRPNRIAISHGCSDFSQERMLSPAQWKQALSAEVPGRAEIIFLGAKKDIELAEAIIEECGSTFADRFTFINECGKKTLAGSLSILAGCDLFVGIDSGLLHYARALGVNSTSFWGPTAPETRLKPIPEIIEKAHYRKIPCSPCTHVAEDPPCHGNNLCIQELFEKGSAKENSFDSFIISPKP